MFAAFICGCATQQEQLTPKNAAVPAGVDLTGRWEMRDDFDDMQRRIELAIRQTDDVDEKKVIRSMTKRSQGGRSSAGRNVGGLVHVFLENAPRLRITQTADGLFISFDRSVVEEYRFGEARTISVGGAVAQRVSGWEGDGYVIETLGRGGMKLTERYELGADRNRLTREIVLRSKDLEHVVIVQTFARESA